MTLATENESASSWVAATAIYEYQRARIEREYADIEGACELLMFFFEKIYPAPCARAAFEPRNRAIRRIIRNPFFKLVFHPVTVKSAMQIIELEQLTDGMNARMAAELIKQTSNISELKEPDYFELCKAATTLSERLRHLRCLLDAMHYSKLLIDGFPALNDVFRVVPSALLRFAGGALDFGIQGYNLLSCHRERLEYYIDAVESRETRRIELMFGMEEGSVCLKPGLRASRDNERNVTDGR